MKLLAPIAALAVLTGAANANAAEVGEIKAAYTNGAFDNVSDAWRRNTANKVAECGSFGRNGSTRLGLLITQYDAIGDALDAGDDSGAMSAASQLSSTINANARFERCWREISRKKKVSREFRSMIRAMEA